MKEEKRDTYEEFKDKLESEMPFPNGIPIPEHKSYLPKNVEKIREGLYVKKGNSGDYRQVYPIRDENGKWIAKNAIAGGNWYNLIFLAVVVAIVLFGVYSYNHDISSYKDVAANPCKFCLGTNYGSNSPVSLNTSTLGQGLNTTIPNK